MSTRREELLKFKIQTEGDRELQALASKLLELGDGSDTAAAQAQQLVDELQRLSTVTGNIRSFVALKASLADTATSLDAAKTKLAAVRTEFDAAEKPTVKLEKAFARASAEVEKLTKQQNKQQAELGKANNALQAAGVDTEKLGSAYAELQQELSEVGASAKDMTTGLDKAGAATKGAAAGVSTLERAAKSSSAALASIATRLTLVSGAATAAIKSLAAISGAALFTGAIRSAATLEDALSQVRAVSGATAEEMVRLKDAAEAGGAATRFSTLEAAQGLGELARATGDATTAIAALPSTLALAQASGIGVAEAATLMTTTLTQFGLGADQAARVADVMAKEVNSTTDSMGGLGNALTYAAPLAKQLGMDVEETASIIGVLADEGFRGERAGTALRNVFTEMLDPASDFSRELRSLGIETSDFAEIITQLAAKGESGKAALLSLDAAARPALTALVDKGGAKLREMDAQLRNSAGEAERTAATMGDNLSGAAESMKDSFDRARRSLVEPLLAPLQAELQTLAAELETFAASPEFEQIKVALTTLFTESATAARQLITEIDFAALSQKISAFLAESGASLQEFTQNMGEVIGTLQTIGNAFELIYNLAQSAVLGIAAVVSKLVEVLASVVDGLSAPARAMLEFLGLIEEGAFDLSNFAGGMGAVAEEFRGRFTSNMLEAGKALSDLQGNVEGASREAERSGERLKDAGNKAAAAGTQMAAAGQEAEKGMQAGAKGAADAASATQRAAGDLEGSASRIKKAYADLGIQSQQQLQGAAEAARRNFELIRDAVRSGEASAEDARRAFAAYAEAARAAVADSDAIARQRVEGELRVQEMLLGTKSALGGVGDASLDMGAKAEEGAGRAGNAYRNMGNAAAGAAGNIQKQGGAATSAGKATENYGKTADAVALTTRKLSDEALNAYRAMNKLAIGLTGIANQRFTDGINRVTAAIERQGSALDARIKQLNDEAEQMDENYGLLQQLRREYHYLAEEEIQRLFQAEVRLKQMREQNAANVIGSAAQQIAAYEAQTRAANEAAAAAEAANDAAGGLTQRSGGLTGRQSAQAPAPPPVREVAPAPSTSSAGGNEIVLRVVSDATGGARLTLTQQQLQDIATAVVRLINQSRSVSA